MLRWCLVLCGGCAGQGGTAEFTPVGPPIAGGAEVWLAGGTTGAPPIVLSVAGSASCGLEGAVFDADLDGVVDIAVTCDAAPPATRRAASVATTETVDEGEALVVWSGAAALGGQVAEIGRRTVPSGSWLAAVPDVDGDGVGELSVAPEWPRGSAEQGWASLVSGADLAGAPIELRGDGLWYPLEPTGLPMGDFDGDGVGDLLVAAWASSSADDHRVYVVSGQDAPSATLDEAALALWTLPAAEERLFSATPVGDLDGDGRWDAVAVTEGGAAYVLFSGTGGGPMSGALSLAGIDLGREGDLRATGLGDLDGDGRHELALSIRRFDSSEDEDTRVAVVPGAALPATGSLSVDPFVIEEGTG